jgi:ribosomal-protein-alanine N-acetyltransferase
MAPKERRRNFATEGGRAAVQYGFEVAGLERIISATVPEHSASRRVMEKCGLGYQGILRYRGVAWVLYAIDLARLPAVP